jgi:hypothetical protein
VQGSTTFFVCCDREVSADYGFTCLPRFMFVVVVTDENWNSSAVQSPVEMKFGRCLGGQIS